jgi:hypothetical protein
VLHATFMFFSPFLFIYILFMLFSYPVPFNRLSLANIPYSVWEYLNMVNRPDCDNTSV